MPKFLQSITFDAERFTEAEACAWLDARGHAPLVVREGAHWRSVQAPAEAFDGDTYETRGADTGISAVAAELRDASRFTGMIHREAQLLDAGEANGAYEATFVASTAAMDSYGDVIEQDGFDLDHYRTNPVVLFNHDPNRPIGRAVDVGYGADGNLRARFRFATAAEGVLGVLAESVGKMVRAGFLSGASVGFMPTQREPILSEDGNPTGGIRFLRSVLKEISVVSIPANHEAIAEARSLGVPEFAIRTLLPPSAEPAARARARRSLAIHERRLALLRNGAGQAAPAH